MIGQNDTLCYKMSSNIQIQRICKYCSGEFIARTTVTQYCSDNCSKRAYKARLRTSKIEASNRETKQIKAKPIKDLKAREFLSVSQVSKLIGCSRQTVYNIINNGKLRAVNILQKKIIIDAQILTLSLRNFNLLHVRSNL